MASYIKFFYTLCILSFVLLITPHCLSAEQNNWAKSSQFFTKIAKSNSNTHYFLAINESQGIALLDENYQALSIISRNAEHLDFRWLPSQNSEGIIATLDVDSGEILLISVNLNTPLLTIKQQFKPLMTSFEAMCLQRNRSQIDLFTVDSQGIATHYNVYNKSRLLAPIEINQFAVGPNINACAVDDQQQTLLIAEENIGVWQYSTDPEHEVVRELIALPQGLEVEYIDTTSEGDIAIVSPDVNTFWYYHSRNQILIEKPLPKDISPKTIQLYRNGDKLQAFMFDDKSSSIVASQWHTIMPPVLHETDVIESLTPFAQTQPVNAYGDAADDPAIWVNSENSAQSIIFTTDKKFGLNTYDLTGKRKQSIPIGRINNIDIRYDIQFAGKRVDIAAASNRTTNSISLFAIDKTTGHATFINDIKTDLTDPYGLCMSNINEQVSVWINDTDGRFQQYQLSFDSPMIKGKKVTEWRVPSQPEGCVVDDKTARLFYGEEATGVWLKHIGSTQKSEFIIGLNSGVKADIEGMGLYTVAGNHYLIVSSQGNNRYAVYAINQNNSFLGVFRISADLNNQIDGASETDGLAVTSVALGSQHPDGLLVVQDGHNVMPKRPQNFKFVDGSLLKKWINSKVAAQ
ncbi:phytase [Thalassotalea hakodatensis]|uniref:phytase n=1 Tax=Thalassotalea hakodatensis TaxID=3030492 RepID=UPI0025722CEF|nr:phytase [Thalassotalea hakodatensis]